MEEEHKYKDVLMGQGLKSTKQRNAVLDVLQNEQVPITADEIYLKLRETGISTSLSTVYRILEVLIAKHLVTKSTMMDDNRAKYVFDGHEHRHHLICLGCTKMVPIEGCPLKELESSLHKSTDFDVTAHKLELYGYCPACKKR